MEIVLEQLENILQRINNDKRFAELDYDNGKIDTSEFTVNIESASEGSAEYDLSFGSAFDALIASIVTTFRKVVRFQADSLTTAEIAIWVERMNRYATELGLATRYEQAEE